MERIIKHLTEREVQESLNDMHQKVLFNNNLYEPIEIDEKNFYDQSKATKRKIVFIDGGNAEILKSATFSLHVCRISYVIFENGKRISNEKIEFYCLVEAKAKGNRIIYESQLFFLNKKIELDNEDLEFDSYDVTLKEGNFQINISRIGEVARRFAEVKIINAIINKLEKGDIIVKDGILLAAISKENKIYHEVYQNLLEKEVILLGFSKTLNMYTNTAESVTQLLLRLSRKLGKNEWFYYPICKNFNPDHLADIYFVKLNENSNYVFRVDVFNKVKYDFSEIFHILKEHSKDAAFLGYPYGLIFADKLARISEDERDYYKGIFIAKAGKKFKEILEQMNDTNAHEVLNNI